MRKYNVIILTVVGIVGIIGGIFGLIGGSIDKKDSIKLIVLGIVILIIIKYSRNWFQG